MKPVYKCDYCNQMGTEEQIREHEPHCYDNYDLKSYSTCEHKTTGTENGVWTFKCDCGIEIPAGKQFLNCKNYERGKRINLDNLLGSMFGGI